MTGWFPFGITVTVQRQGEDKWGKYVTVSEHQVAGCALNNTGSSRSLSGGGASRESTFGQDTVEGFAELYLPPGADIVATDRIVTPDGARWSVTGAANQAVNPFTGWAPGGVVAMELVTG